jgi:murein DD-endopeptidase MepM/ murein hydrolase activator NlpD
VFTPIVFAPRFVSPIAGVPYEDWTIVHYVDLDPTTGVRDYHGGSYTYDGHDAIDLRIPNFAAMDRGVAVYAAAAGTVTSVHDGEFDRCTFEARCDTPANVVYVDHGNGWSTRYVHLRTGSIIVSPGQVVSAGQPLGLVGSSGWSGHPHLHFSVYYSGTAVETFVAPDSYWVNPWPYAGDTPGALDAGMTDHSPTITELRERPIEQASFAPGESAVFWVNYHSVHAGDRIDFIWHRPNGSRHFTSTRVAVESSFRWSWSTITVPLIPGEWRVRFAINGVEFAGASFVVAI